MVMSSAKPRNAPHRIFLWTQPRTCSNVIVRALDKHPELEQIIYPMMLPFFFGPDRIQGAPHFGEFERVSKVLVPKFEDKSMQTVADKIQRSIAKAEAEGKTVFIKEHVAMCTRFEVFIGSPELVVKVVDHQLDLPSGADDSGSSTDQITTSSTVYPDRFLKTFSPVFTIRHPAHMVASYFRASKKVGFAADMSYRWVRLLFDWYKSQPDCQPGWPVVVDGDDLVNDTEGIMEQLCDICGLDPRGVHNNWDVGKNEMYGDPPEEFRPIDAMFRGSIHNSTGVQKDARLLREPVVEEEMVGWISEFGEEGAKVVRSIVDGSMADYEHLKEFRLRPRMK